MWPLEMHHVGHPRDNSAFNAETLCRECHAREHRKRIERQRGGFRTYCPRCERKTFQFDGFCEATHGA
jgi:hypothetical protein